MGMNITFIYCPKSGDRVFAEKTNKLVVTAKYSNGCRHVFGGVLLEHATVTRAHRNMARRIATVFIKKFGGIAWGIQGLVCAVVPVGMALSYHRMMMACASANHHNAGKFDTCDSVNNIRLLAAGWQPNHHLMANSLDMDAGVPHIMAVHVKEKYPRQDEVGTPKWYLAVEYTLDDLDGNRLDLCQTVPIDWLPPCCPASEVFSPNNLPEIVWKDTETPLPNWDMLPSYPTVE